MVCAVALSFWLRVCGLKSGIWVVSVVLLALRPPDLLVRSIFKACSKKHTWWQGAWRRLHAAWQEPDGALERPGPSKHANSSQNYTG